MPIGPAAVCVLQRKATAALESVIKEAHGHIAGLPADVDETGRREGRTRGWLWAAVTARVTVFLVGPSRARKVLGELIAGRPGVLTTDRYPAYDHLPAGQRQVCWAHLRRDFQATIDRRTDGSAVGEDLLTDADIRLAQWKRVRDGTPTRRGFRQSYLGRVRTGIRDFFKRGVESACAATPGVCRELLAIEPALDTFAAVGGVEPTNNAAERALRHAVCWRTTGCGTDSAGGSRFVERVLTVVATCRQQGRGVVTVLTEALHPPGNGAPRPSLTPVGTPTP